MEAEELKAWWREKQPIEEEEEKETSDVGGGLDSGEHSGGWRRRPGLYASMATASNDFDGDSDGGGFDGEWKKNDKEKRTAKRGKERRDVVVLGLEISKESSSSVQWFRFF